MNATRTVIMAMIVAIAMIGMTGLAMAGSAMDYTIDFSGAGDGSMAIYTSSPVGSDVQTVNWDNCDVMGRQTGKYNGGQWMKVDRKTTITGIQNGDPARGLIFTQSKPTTPVSDPAKIAHVTTLAAYHDDDAYGSHVKLVQGVTLRDSDAPVINDAGYEYADVDTTITGYAYDSGTAFVRGSVASVTDGSLNAATGISALVSDGRLRMVVDSRINDYTNDRETSHTRYWVYVRSPGDTADGFVSGYASVNGVLQTPVYAPFINRDVTAVGYFYAVTL